ncbi:MAG TPA: FAD-dependent oxidoreductase [Acidimicrobiales bacterium]|nr:FAD-dependent oxidoreductase [Acidimicrobiales bacterium]
MTDVVVVGGGPAGLTAAWRAACAGRTVRVLERAPVVGGMAASIEVAGQRVDLGSHRLHPATSPHVLAAIRSLLGDDLQVRPRHGRVLLRNRWIAFPLRAADLARHMPPTFAARALADALTRPMRRARADTFAEVVRVRLGRAVLDEFYGPYAVKLWGVDARALAGELARRRISAGGPGAIARRLVRSARPQGRTFLYPRLGYGEIVERLAEAAVDAGAVIDVNTPVASLTDLDGERVLWTAPITGLVHAAGDAPADVRRAASALVHRAMVLVYLVVDQSHYTEFDAHYLPAATLPVSRLSEPKNYREGPDPADQTVLCAEVPCWVDDGTWSASSADLAGMVVDTLARAGLPVPLVAAVDVRRLPRVYPVYTPAALAALDTVDAWATTLPRVRVFGRQGLFVGDNLHHVMAMGWDAGELAAHEALGGDAGDLDAWAAARARYSTHVVED